ncbi:hypothetical protein G9A89_002125 [Geosiphon pyriformis]|nr:hypothetical protein G9A89_002125 [Geosiphon pyriformis]
MALVKQTILITGATGNVGSSAVKAFLEQGATVIAISRSQSSLDKLIANLKSSNVSLNEKNFHGVLSDVSEDKNLEKVANDIREGRLPEPNHIVSSSGPWWFLPALHEVTFEKWGEAMKSNFNAHFVIYRNFVPFVLNKPNTSYTLVTGSAGLSEKTGVTGITQNCLYGLSKVVIHETSEKPIRFNELRISLRIEDDATFDKSVAAGQIQVNAEQNFASREFGKIFTALAQSNLKGQIVEVNSRAQFNEFVKKWS